jgi:hypothetical protein
MEEDDEVEFLNSNLNLISNHSYLLNLIYYPIACSIFIWGKFDKMILIVFMIVLKLEISPFPNSPPLFLFLVFKHLLFICKSYNKNQKLLAEKGEELVIDRNFKLNNSISNNP